MYEDKEYLFRMIIFYDHGLFARKQRTLKNRVEKTNNAFKELSKKQVDPVISLLNDQNDPRYLDRLKHIGRVHHDRKIDPVWIMGAYRLYQKHLSTIIVQSSQILDTERSSLNDCLNKLLFRDMGMMLEGYWQAANRNIETEKDKVEHLQRQISDLLTNIPQVIWSIDVVNNTPLYVSPTVEEISPISMELPIPCLGWTIPDDRPKVEASWARAMTGETITVAAIADVRSVTIFASLPDLTTAADADIAIGLMDTALTTVNTARAGLGALQSRFESVVSNLAINAENASAARGRSLDADFAAETASLTKNQILQQAGTAMLAQANSIPQNVLSLLR